MKTWRPLLPLQRRVDVKLAQACKNLLILFFPYSLFELVVSHMPTLSIDGHVVSAFVQLMNKMFLLILNILMGLLLGQACQKA